MEVHKLGLLRPQHIESEIRSFDASQPAIETAIYVKHILDEVLEQLSEIDIKTNYLPVNLAVSVDSNHLFEPNLLDKHEPLTQVDKDTLLIMEDNKATID